MLAILFHKDYIQRAEKTLKSLNNEKVMKVETELVLIKKDGKNAYMDITANKIDFAGINAIQVTLRDTSKLKAEMDKASKIQKVRMEKYPVDLEKKLSFATVYIPKHIVSGDFFHIFRTGENEMVGFLGSSNGSGVSAALLNSAVKVIINDVITKTTEPETFLNHDS
jgi:serine phosphatase RsbU (regulator of sigma subunit)